MKAEEVLTRDSLDIKDEIIIMNSGFTKILFFIYNDFIIYDSRVGAALCYLVKLYCIEQKQGGVPSSLNSPMVMPEIRRLIGILTATFTNFLNLIEEKSILNATLKPIGY